jgi:hypothetical protein
VQWIEGAMSEDLRSSDASHDMSEKPISLDFTRSMNIVGSSDDIESEHIHSSGALV